MLSLSGWERRQDDGKDPGMGTEGIDITLMGIQVLVSVIGAAMGIRMTDDVRKVLAWRRNRR